MRVLVVEDEMTIAMMVEDMLCDLGHEVCGIAMRLPEALTAAESLPAEMVILDINLDGHKSFPVADLLLARGIPFVFATGYGRAGVDIAYRTAPVLSKPFNERALGAAIEAAVAVFSRTTG